MVNDEKQNPKQASRWFWRLFVAAMGCFVAYNLYKALEAFRVIE